MNPRPKYLVLLAVLVLLSLTVYILQSQPTSDPAEDSLASPESENFTSTSTLLPQQSGRFEDLLTQAAEQAPFALLLPDEHKLPFKIQRTGVEVISQVDDQPYVVRQTFWVKEGEIQISQSSLTGQTLAKAVGEVQVRGGVGFLAVLNTGKQILYWEEKDSSVTIGGDLTQEEFLSLAESLGPRKMQTSEVENDTHPPTAVENPTAASLETALGPSRLRVDEYALKSPSTLEPLTFTPLQDTQAEILARHSRQRQANFGDNSYYNGGDFSMRSKLAGEALVASDDFNPAGSDGWVALARNGGEIYQVYD